MFELQTVESLYSLIEIMKGSPVDPALIKFDRELIPILAKFLSLKPRNHDHPIAKQLFNWLVDPQRTGEQFLYVITILQDNAYDFKDYVDNKVDIEDGTTLGKIAIEAFAVLCPIIEGPWEQVAWILTVIEVGYGYSKRVHGTASTHLTEWFLHVIHDSDICPNIYLRFSLMNLLLKMSDPVSCNQKLILESVLSACTTLSMQYPDICLDTIQMALQRAEEDEFLLEFDEHLSEQLLDVKAARLSALFHDVAHHTAVNPNKVAQPMVLHGLSGLLVYISERTRLAVSQGFGGNIKQDDVYDNIMYILRTIKTKLPKSCKTPQLVDQVNVCCKDLVEYIWKIDLF